MAGGKFTQTIYFRDRQGKRASVRVVIDKAGLDALIALKASPVGQEVKRQITKGQRFAKETAPVSSGGSHGRSPGYLRSRIGGFLGQDDEGVYGEVVTRARSKASKKKTWYWNTNRLTKAGAPRKQKVATSKAAYYGRIQNQKGPHKGYMGRALERLTGG